LPGATPFPNADHIRGLTFSPVLFFGWIFPILGKFFSFMAALSTKWQGLLCFWNLKLALRWFEMSLCDGTHTKPDLILQSGFTKEARKRLFFVACVLPCF